MNRVNKPGKKAHGNVAQILRFFEENPGELLSLDDMQVKFGLTQSQARTAAKYMQRNGMVNQLRVFSLRIGESKFPGVDIDAAHRTASEPEQVSA